MNDVSQLFQFLQENTSTTGYVEKLGGTDVKVWGGAVLIDGESVSTADTTFTLTNGQTNYIYFDLDTNAFLSTVVLGNVDGPRIANVTCSGGQVSTIEPITYRFSSLSSGVAPTGPTGPTGPAGSGST